MAGAGPMDKLSTKLRLVRSQSMGVGMAAASSLDASEKPTVVRRMAAAHQKNEARLSTIVLLDERRLEVVVQPQLDTGQLLDLVASHCGLKEKEYFGLAVVDESGHYTWLQLNRKVLDHDLPRKPQTLTIHFLVKFFIESIAHLAENKTIELFYLQARNLIFRGTLEVEADIVFQLAALALQASSGDYVDPVLTQSLIKKSPILPANVLKEHSSLAHCEEQVIEHYKKTRGQTRGQAVVNYMTIVESMPTYGVHYFEVYDKRQVPWWLGLSCRGIAQYKYNDRKVPVHVFPWTQLENLYFRDKKFSIEVHDAKRVVQKLSNVNLYEDALKLDVAGINGTKDELVDAIAEVTTQVSVSRRSFNPGAIHVYVWFGKTQGLTKCIWQSAISQHQFYLDRKQAKNWHQPMRTLKDIARDLTHSTVSLSSASSLSNLSRTESMQSLGLAAGTSGSNKSSSHEATTGGSGASEAMTGSSGLEQNDPAVEALRQQQSEEAKRARLEMVAALKARKEALEAKLKDKQKLLKELCIKEGELTGELPPEIPLAPGEPVPQIRRRVGTEFALSEKTLVKKQAQSPEEELLASLELEFEIQSKITSAANKLANDASASKSVRKQRKINYQQSLRKLKEIETKLNALKYYGTKHKRKQHRPEDGDIRDIRQGVSLPDLDISISMSESQAGLEADNDETDAVDSGSVASPRSCPASPRKNSAVLATSAVKPHLRQVQPDSISLESSPQRISRGQSGYPSSSIYRHSSYRSKPLPSLIPSVSTSSTARPLNVAAAPLLATTDMMMLDSSSSSASVTPAGQHRSATLPTSPFRNKYESHLTQCDSPIGLYNCPQQRTSQAFSSMDDLDAMLGATSSISSSHSTTSPMAAVLNSSSSRDSSSNNNFAPGLRPPLNHGAPFPTVRLEAAAQNKNYPSLERSIRKHSNSLSSSSSRGPLFGYSSAMANRELPALPSSAATLSKKPVKPARSMEDLESLEAAGIRGKAKMHYREVLNGGETVSLADAMLSKMNMAGSRPHHLPNTEEYPPHHSPLTASRSTAAVNSHNMLGIRPLDTGGPYPTSHVTSGGTLLPGQTYPEPSAKPSSTVSSLQDVFYSQQRSSTASTSAIMGGSSLKVETTFGLKDSIHTKSREDTVKVDVSTSSADREESPPPLYPKQYHQVVEQRRRSGIYLANTSGASNSSAALVAAVAAMPVPPRSLVSESPAVNRKVKLMLATPPPLPPISSSAVASNKINESLDSAGLPESPSKGSITSVTNSISNSSSNISSGNKYSGMPPYHLESTKPFEMSDFYKYSTKFRKQSTSSMKSNENIPPGVSQDCHRESDSPGSSTASGSGSTGPPPEIPSRTPTKAPPPQHNNNVKSSNIRGERDKNVADDFATEMIAWYNSTSTSSSHSKQAMPMRNKVAPVPPAKPKAQVPIPSTSTSNSKSDKPATLI